jgi:UDP-N-acetylmuramate: L-alanyl-gamma-D-glutamyl-meso-diaminopimelate ligase
MTEQHDHETPAEITPQRLYFIGIGGIAMSAAAGIARELGHDVMGSDNKEVYEPAKTVLANLDIPYHQGYDAQNIVDSHADLFIASSGEGMNNPEVAYVREHDLPLQSFSELLYNLSGDKLRVVVAGTHGKSTTTGLLGHTLRHIDNSSFMTGAVLQGEQTNFHTGDGHYFVFEGDEYKALFDDPTPKFHQYKADILVLTNLEFDHPDLYSNLDELKDEFRLLIADMPADGIIVYNADDKNLAELVHESNLGTVSFGLHNPADFSIDTQTIETAPGKTIFTVKRGGKPDEQYESHLPGNINLYNGLAVIATLRTLGFEEEAISEGLDSYYGVKRRFELISDHNGIAIYDDYAHHPTAIAETIAATRTWYPNNRLLVVFEPHTFSRTQSLLPELAKSFIGADKVLIAEIYPAREVAAEHSITGQQVVEAIKAHNPDVALVADKTAALAKLSAEVQPGDVVIVMAVGSFNRLATELASSLSGHDHSA